MSARILVVDDNDENLDLMMYVLQAFGHHVTGARRAAEALRALECGSFDLILSDIRMPECDGYQLARLIGAMPGSNAIPMVAVTAFAMVGDRENILAGGFDGYITKPIEPQSFLQAVELFLPPELRSAACQSS